MGGESRAETPTEPAKVIQPAGGLSVITSPKSAPASSGEMRSESATTPVGEVASKQGDVPSRDPCELPVGYLADKLEDAERLLSYAAESGIEVTDSVRAAVLTARLQSPCGLSDENADRLLAALTALTASVRPVTAATLKTSADPRQSKLVIGEYTRVALWLSCFIVPFSLLTFASSAISDAIRKDTDTANALAVKLSDELGPPRANQDPGARQGSSTDEAVAGGKATDANHPTPSGTAAAGAGASGAAKVQDEAGGAATRGESGRIGVNRLPRGTSEKDALRDLQQFAATIRAIDARARQLDMFILNSVLDPLAMSRGDRAKIKALLELPADLPDLPRAATDKIAVYQDVRYFAQSIQETVSVLYGAVGSTILPVLYALLGACAFLLRSFQEQIKNRTLQASDGHSARFLIAAIGGFVVGLFNNFNIAQGIALPPLAIAFLVGYAVDVFFSFLEGILQAFDRSRASAPTPPAKR